ncbi:ADP-ribosylglycohydrolase family protein [Pirellulaceae bacterium SH449]
MPDDESESKLFPTVSLSWERSAGVARRERSAEGMIWGVAIGESLALARDGMSKWNGFRLFGRPPLKFCFKPGAALPGEQTHGMLITLQAIFQSRADHRLFSKCLKKRIWTYRTAHGLSEAARILIPKFKGGADSYAFRGRLACPLIRALPISLLVQGTANAKAWLELSNGVTTDNDASIAASLLIAQAMQITQLYDARELGAQKILLCLIENTQSSEIKSLLRSCEVYLEKRYSIARVSARLGYLGGVPKNTNIIAVLSVYAWLRHLENFRTVVERTACLGGECALVAAIAGGLSGACNGKKTIPADWLEQAQLYPYRRNWLKKVIARITDWPHGVEDIRAAHAEPSYPLGQCIRNTGICFLKLFHFIIRLPTLFLPTPRSRVLRTRSDI